MKINFAKNLKPLFIFIIFCFLLNTYTPSFYFADSPQPGFKESLIIENSKISHSKVDEYGYVSCIGYVQNNSNVAWEDLTFEVQFFNSKGELIDTFTEKIYDMVLPPNDKIAFRIKNEADKSIEEYQSFKVRITSAQQMTRSKPKKTYKNTIQEIIISWLPMFLLIGVWIFFMKKLGGKKSPQKRVIEIQEKQYSLIEEQNKLFEKLINTIKEK